MRNFRKLITLLLIIFMIMTTVSPVFAWKLNTHVYSGNLILDDLRDGYLEIDGMGKYKVPQDIYNAVTKYPKAYRAGTLGPDIYPEMPTGQGNIHPLSEKANSGKYLQLMVDAYHKLPTTHPEREKILAFILGFATHYAGDMFGHSFINTWAEGSFPGMEEMAKDPDMTKVALRHIAAEGYVDSKVPDYQKKGNNIMIDAPTEFIKEVLIDEASRKYEVSPYLDPITKFRDVLKEKAETLKAYQGTSLSLKEIAKYGVNTNIAGYAERWQEDIDTGLIELVKANEEMAKAMLDKDKGSSDAIEPISNWINEHGMVMAGSPDVLAKYLGLSVDTVLELLDLMTTEDLRKKLQETKKDAMFWAVERATGVNIDEMMDAIKHPVNLVNSDLFKTGSETSKLIDKQLVNFGNTNNPKDIEFKPFYNTVQMGKLILLGYENLNKIFPNSNFKKQEMVESFNKVDITIRTGPNSWKTIDHRFRGTDDDIFFVLKLKDGKVYEKLMDKPGYNDFEEDETDKYTLEIPEYITYEMINSVGVRKSKITNLDWYPEWIEVRAKGGKLITESGWKKNEGSFHKVFKGNDKWSKSVNVSNSVRGYSNFDPSIITFIKSLDESKQWIYSNIFVKDSNVFNKIFKGFNQNQMSDFIVLDSASNWAISELKDSINNDIYTTKLVDNFKKQITREEFCELVVLLYEKATGNEALLAPAGTFKDTNNPAILKAYKLGITGGTGQGKFSPNATITREQMAVMYHRLIEAIENKDITVNSEVTYNDSSQISSWAKESINYCTKVGILNGTGNNKFSPKGTASGEVSIIVTNRLYNKIKVKFKDNFNDKSDNEYILNFNNDPSKNYLFIPEGNSNLAILDGHSFKNVAYTLDIKLGKYDGYNDAGLLFNVSDFNKSQGTLNGYYVRLKEDNDQVSLGVFEDFRWKGALSEVDYVIEEGKRYTMRVEYNNGLIKVYINDMSNPVIVYNDSNRDYKSGAVGLKAYKGEAHFDNLKVEIIK